MRLSIHAVGRMKSGPARELLDIYASRSARAGKQLGIRDLDIREYAESRSGRAIERKDAEATSILQATQGTLLVALDENGDDLSSSQFAAMIRSALEEGRSEMAFTIGGADGHGADLLSRAERKIRFGKLTWPHQLVRIMLAEQLYRAITILSGHPYHRE